MTVMPRKSRRNFVAGPLRFSEGVLRHADEEVLLTPKERAVLQALAVRRGTVVPPELLLTDVWGNAAVGTESVHRAVSTLRAKIRANGCKGLISTVYGRGYRLVLSRADCHHAASQTRLATNQAAELVEQARSLIGRRLQSDLELAHRMLQRAAVIAPVYLPAHIMAAHLHLTQAMRSFCPSRAAAFKAEEAARKALELSPKNSEMLAVLGWSEAVIHGRETGIRLLDQAMENRTTEWLPLFYRGWALAGLGRFDEALEDFEMAMELSPLALGLHGAYGYVLLCSGAIERAYEVMRRSVNELPVSDTAHGAMSISASLLGRHEDAINAARRGYELSSHPMLKAQLGYALAAAGQIDEATRLCSELTQTAHPTVVPCHVAALAVSLGNRSAARDLLELAHSESCPFRYLASHDPRLQSFHSDFSGVSRQ